MRTLCFQCRRSRRKRLLFQCNRFDALAACAVSDIVSNSHFARKLVSVEFAAFGLAFPTFSFGFLISLAKKSLGYYICLQYLEILFLVLFLFLRACRHDGVQPQSR
jgi:hypothetical protein